MSFQGSGSDPEEGLLTGSSLTWESSQGGQLGTGESVTTSSLATGDHTVTLTAEDSEGATGTDQISITIQSQNSSPSATIDQPADGATFNEGEQVSFQGSGSDPEEGLLTGSSLTWESSQGGQLGTGESVTTSSLATGDHTVTLTAEDSEGATGTDQISITVETTMTDTTPPELESLSLTPDSVDVSSDSAVVTSEARLTDSGTGVARLSIMMESPSGNQITGFQESFNPVSGTRNDGTWRVELTIPQSAEGI